jgi:cell division protein FtsI (penicillin-binding protein 3)
MTAAQRQLPGHSPVARLVLLALMVLGGFGAVGGQLVRLAATGAPAVQLSLNEPIARNWSRPDILDRNGLLLATDVAVPSLYADPRQVIDRDEAVEKLRLVFPDLDERELRRQLADDGRRFVWIRRGLTPAIAQRVHDLGLPGLAFRRELKRVHPAGRLAAHIVGQTNVDNRGLSGIERFIDDSERSLLVGEPTPSKAPPVRLSLDIGVQHGLGEELAQARARYKAKAAAGLVLDVHSGEVLAAASLPDGEGAGDHIMASVYELGSVMKPITVAMALEAGTASLESTYDARQPLEVAGTRIDDHRGQKRVLTAREVLLYSSNIGAGLMAQELGSVRQRELLGRLGLTERVVTEAAAIADPLLPRRWGEAETVTIAYGHGLAVAPLQFAAAAAALANGGLRVTPSFLAAPAAAPRRVLRAAISAQMQDLLRDGVAHPKATGRRAAVEGIEIGGKTGTADIARGGRYAERAVIASFLGVFPAPSPRYLTFLMLIEPEPTIETIGQVTAGHNAAPATARLIRRIAPLLGIASAASFDGGSEQTY